MLAPESRGFCSSHPAGDLVCMHHANKAEVAYARFEGRGSVPDHHVADWFAAERYIARTPTLAAAVNGARLDAFGQEFLASRFLLLSRYDIDATYEDIQGALQQIHGVDSKAALALKRLSAERIA